MSLDLQAPTYGLELRDASGALVDMEAVDLRGAILSIEWEEATEGHSTLRLEIENDDLRWFDTALFLPGNRLTFSLGYPESMTPSRTYSVRSIRGFRTLQVEGADEAVQLSQTARTEVYPHKTYSEVAREVAGRAGFSEVIIDDLPPTLRHEEVVQSNESDAQFLQRLALGADFVFRTEGSRLRFHRPRLEAAPATLISYFTGGQVLDATFDMDLLNLAPEVVARGFDPKEKRGFEVRVDAATADRTTLGKTTVYALLQEGPEGSLVRIERPAGESGPVVGTAAPTPELAEGEAQAHFNATEREQDQAELRVLGDPALRAGALVTLEGFGRLLDGNYYVVKAAHRVGSSGYETRVGLSRNAVGRVAEEQPEEDLADRNEQKPSDQEQVYEVGVLDPDRGQIVRTQRRGPA